MDSDRDDLRPLTAVMTVVIGFLLFSLATHRSDTVLAAQLTADHAKCFRLFAKSDAPDGDARLIEQRLADDYGWNLHVPPSSAANGVRLIGARRCLYADGPVSHVMYRLMGTMCHSLSWMASAGRPTTSSRSVIVPVCGPRAGGRMSWCGPSTAGDLTAAARYVKEEAR